MNASELIDDVASVAHDAGLIEEPLTAEYVSRRLSCSVRHAARLLQYWDGAGRPVLNWYTGEVVATWVAPVPTVCELFGRPTVL